MTENFLCVVLLFDPVMWLCLVTFLSKHQMFPFCLLLFFVAFSLGALAPLRQEFANHRHGRAEDRKCVLGGNNSSFSTTSPSTTSPTNVISVSPDAAGGILLSGAGLTVGWLDLRNLIRC